MWIGLKDIFQTINTKKVTNIIIKIVEKKFWHSPRIRSVHGIQYISSFSLFKFYFNVTVYKNIVGVKIIGKKVLNFSKKKIE